MKRQIVIEIDDEDYKYLKNGYFINTSERSGKTLLQKFLTAIYKGTPLPKGHGRLIDADAFIKFLRHKEYGMIDYSDCVIDDITENTSTIIEADKETNDGE